MLLSIYVFAMVSILSSIVHFQSRKSRFDPCTYYMTHMNLLFKIVAILSVIQWGFHYKKYGFPPTDLAEDGNKAAIMAFGGLALLAPFGFIILAFRISNIFIGLVVGGYIFLHDSN
jgi:hypothetical protein